MRASSASCRAECSSSRAAFARSLCLTASARAVSIACCNSFDFASAALLAFAALSSCNMSSSSRSFHSCAATCAADSEDSRAAFELMTGQKVGDLRHRHAGPPAVHAAQPAAQPSADRVGQPWPQLALASRLPPSGPLPSRSRPSEASQAYLPSPMPPAAPCRRACACAYSCARAAPCQSQYCSIAHNIHDVKHACSSMSATVFSPARARRCAVDLSHWSGFPRAVSGGDGSSTHLTAWTTHAGPHVHARIRMHASFHRLSHGVVVAFGPYL